jgi:flagellar assembly protein FliH
LSSSILRKAVFEEDPLIIEHEILPTEQDLGPQDELVEAIQQEHPDAMPEEIEDAIQEAIDQLREAAELQEPAPAEELPSGEQSPIDGEAVQSELLAEEPQPPAQALPEASSETILNDARTAAADILETARREAQKVLAGADDRAAEIERAAYDKGYEEGVSAGRAAGEQQAAEMIQQVTTIVDRATELHDLMLREAEAEMVALCLEIARKVIHAELRTNPDVVKSVLEDAVEKINGSPRVTIKVNPAQLETVRAHWARAFGPNYREKEWTIEGDGSVEPGGCVLDTKYGSIDARIGTQFSELQKTFALLLGTD